MGSTSLPASSWWHRCPHFLGFLSLLKPLSGSQPLIPGQPLVEHKRGFSIGLFHCGTLVLLQLESGEGGGVSHLQDHGLDVGEYEPLHDFPLSWE